MTLHDELHIMARELVASAIDRGAVMDKKQLRYNDIVECGKRYAESGAAFSDDVAREGVKEAVRACVVGDPMHVKGGSVLDLVPDWMIVQ